MLQRNGVLARAVLTSAVLVGLMALAFAAPAQADDYHVTDSAELTSALATVDAASGDGLDRIYLAPGTYDTTSGFSLAPGHPADLIGSGVGQTTLTTDTNGVTVMALDFSAAGGSVSGMTVTVRHSPTSTPVAIALTGGTATDLDVQVSGTGGGIGLRLGGGASLSDSTIAVDDAASAGVAGANGSFALTNTKFSGANGAGLGVVTLPGANIGTIDDSTFSALGTGVYDASGTIAVSNSLFDLGSHDEAVAALAYTPIANPLQMTLNVDRSTVVGDGGGQEGVFAHAAYAGQVAQATVTDSLIALSGDDAMPLGCAQDAGLSGVAGSFDALRTGDTSDDDACSIALQHTVDLNVHPAAFVSAATGDFRPSPGSAVIDAGDPGATIADGAKDMTGAPRMTDGDGDGVARIDIGANEYQRPAASPPAAHHDPAPVLSIVGGSRTWKAKRGKSLTVLTRSQRGAMPFSLSGPATLRLTLRQTVKCRKSRHHGHKAHRSRKSHHGCNRHSRSVTVTFALGAGRHWLRLGTKVGRSKLGKGKYNVSAQPIGGDGTAGATVRIKFIVR